MTLRQNAKEHRKITFNRGVGLAKSVFAEPPTKAIHFGVPDGGRRGFFGTTTIVAKRPAKNAIMRIARPVDSVLER
jgi:hypothetical protein